MDDWTTIDALIRKLDEELEVPVTAKIRVYDDPETTLKYAEMVEAAGAQLVAVHGRTREQKRCSDVRANWAFIREIKKRLKVPVLANGDIRTLEEARKCLEATGADGVLACRPSAREPEPVFGSSACPPPDPNVPLPVEGDANCKLLLQYLELTQKHPTPMRMIKGHVHKMVGPWLAEFTDLRLAQHHQVRPADARESGEVGQGTQGAASACDEERGARATHPEEERKSARAGSSGGGKGGRHRGTGTGRVCRRGCVARPSARAAARVFLFLVFPTRRWVSSSISIDSTRGWQVRIPSDRDIRLISEEDISERAWRHVLPTDASRGDGMDDARRDVVVFAVGIRRRRLTRRAFSSPNLLPAALDAKRRKLEDTAPETPDANGAEALGSAAGAAAKAASH